MEWIPVKQEPIRTKRKVQQLGSSTLAVTVPAEWARTHNVEKGDEIVVQQDNEGGALLIVPQQPDVPESEASLDADVLSGKALERALITQYILGRHLIRIEGTTALGLDHRDGVLAAERRLMGLSAVEEGGTYMTVRCSVAPDDFDLQTMLERLGRTETSMRRGAIDALIEGDIGTARQVSSRYHQIEKLYFLFLRLSFATYRNPRLSQAIGIESGFPLIAYRSVVQEITQMAETAVEIGELVTQYDGTAPGDDMAQRLREIATSLDDAMNTIWSVVSSPSYQEAEAARDALNTVDESIATFHETLRTERPEPVLLLQRVADLLERTASHAEDSLSVLTQLSHHQAGRR
ncbi:AbrB/MazE/SpoVT family DNA-binding domain-containing protein (plasmid) [Haloarcula salina]|uniref:AbrB/MazE/SpoVT family DNA-binding domain-containing protein n=1 Tax=Haloarcula salina TaxID=1429914 RepID=UPI003C7023CD